MSLGHIKTIGACLTVVTAGLFSALTAAPANAAPVGSGGGVACLAGTPAAKDVQGIRHDDQHLAPGQAKVLAKELKSRLAGEGVHSMSARAAATSLAPVVDIPVYAHVIIGSHKGDRTMTAAQVRTAVGVLRNAYRGGQSPYNTLTRYFFQVKAIDFTKNDTWFHATLFNAADVQEKRALHKGGPRSLNLYFTGGGQTAGGTLLGYSTFPWQAKGAPLKDSVTVNAQAMPGGNLTRYNLGDTVVHETGHWLGLLHPFEGGCSEPNDGVADTPEESQPANACTAFLCDSDSYTGINEARNFMDYAYDNCMNRFTPGQVARMDQEFIAYRK